MKLTAATLGIMNVVAVHPAWAFAQAVGVGVPPAAAAPPRAGLRLAVQTGTGYVAPYRCGDCVRFKGGGWNIGADVGTTVRPDLAVVASFGLTWIPFADRTSGGLLELTLGAQHWIHDRVWVRGAAGFGMLDLTARRPQDTEANIAWSAGGLALTGAAGYEIVRRSGTFAAHLELRPLWLYTGDISTVHLALLFGVSWH